MPTEMAILLVTGAIAAMAVLVYLWTAGASLLTAIEIHLLRVETHRLRIDYARRIAELAGEVGVDILDGEVDILDDDEADAAGAAMPIGSVAPEAVGMKAAA